MSETEFASPDAPTNGDDEPTMEEILSSIRRIISDDETTDDTDMAAAIAAEAEIEEPEMDMAAAMEAEDEILELTDILAEEDGFDEDVELLSPDDVDDLEFSEPIAEEPVLDPEPVAPVVAETITPEVSVSESLISNKVGEAVNQNFNLLANTMLAQNGAGQTVESMVMALMRPMLKGWLDENLPVMVEKIIREEIERVARGGKM